MGEGIKGLGCWRDFDDLRSSIAYNPLAVFDPHFFQKIIRPSVPKFGPIHTLPLAEPVDPRRRYLLSIWDGLELGHWLKPLLQRGG